jgi:16S rRNA C967 or C1407 C5-methylase (RsmB/RsmF family)
MFPEAFKKRISGQHYLNADTLLQALGLPSPVSIRLNLVKWSNVPENGDRVPWCSEGWYLESRPSFTSDPLFHSGCYYPQEASGMILEEAFKQAVRQVENIRVLDLCGAPGGKSTHLSTIIGNNGVLISNEVIRPRASILAENLTKWGAANAIVTHNDPSAFSRLEGYFDVAVIDAPCSGEGMFRDQEIVKEWSEANTALCTERQKRILSEVWPSIKEKGILIYSTCTFNPGENEENLKWLLEKHTGTSIGLNISMFPGITEINYQGIKGYGFYPDKIRGEGFFIAVVQKLDAAREPARISQKKSGLMIPFADISVAERWTADPAANFFRHGDDVYSLAVKKSEFLFLQKNLKIIKGVTLLFTINKNEYLQSY